MLKNIVFMMTGMLSALVCMDEQQPLVAETRTFTINTAVRKADNSKCKRTCLECLYCICCPWYLCICIEKSLRI